VTIRLEWLISKECFFKTEACRAIIELRRQIFLRIIKGVRPTAVGEVEYPLGVMTKISSKKIKPLRSAATIAVSPAADEG